MRDRESRSMSDMFEEQRAKMAMLGHGVRERSNNFGKQREGERKDCECLS